MPPEAPLTTGLASPMLAAPVPASVNEAVPAMAPRITSPAAFEFVFAFFDRVRVAHADKV